MATVLEEVNCRGSLGGSSCLNVLIIRLIRKSTGQSKALDKAPRQIGHISAMVASILAFKHSLQNVCKHGVVIGLVNTSLQIGHVISSSSFCHLESFRGFPPTAMLAS